MRTLSFEPLIPPALWLTLTVTGLALLVWYGWARPSSVPRRRWAVILGLTASGLGLVLGVLLNPTWIEPVAPPAGKPLLTVLVDATASMATPDGPEGRTRFQAAARLARAFAQDLGDQFEVQVSTFAGSVTPVDANTLEARTPDGQVTDLAAALADSLGQDRPQGQKLILLSDGIHNAGGGAARVLEAARLAKAVACPLYTQTFGGAPAVRDLAVELRAAQELAFIGQKVSLDVLLRQRGFTGRQATLVLTHGGQELERRAVPLTPQETQEVHFQVGQDKPGVYRYDVRAEPLAGELSRSNNAGTMLLRVVDKPVRVLLLEGKPYWDAKFLMRTLFADPSLEVDSVVRLGDNRLLRRSLRRTEKGSDPRPAQPAAAQEEWKILTEFAGALAQPDLLRSYQVLVLGRDADLFLIDPVLAQLRTWVMQDGGCVVCYRGQPTAQVNQRLDQLLPLRWAAARESRFRVNLTERGREFRWFAQAGSETPGAALSGLPTLATAARPEGTKPLAVVLATAVAQPADTEDPVVTYQSYGSGRIVVIEGAGMWRWAFLPPQQQLHQDVYRSLWHSLLRWLVSSADLLPGQKLALRSDKVSFGTTEPATATLLLHADSAKGQVPAVELRGDGIDGRRTITPVALGEEPGAFRVVFGNLPEGRYEARVAGTEGGDAAARTAFDVRSLFEEQLDLKARPDLMARIAQASGGAVLEGIQVNEVISQFREHLERGQPPRIRRLSAWDRWWVLLAVFGVWSAAWTVRRSGGLV
jgi:hypothetical protein